jgi:uncharacterized membrane protein YfcA
MRFGSSAYGPSCLAGILGVPLGAELLRSADPAHVRGTVGVLLVAFVIYSVLRPAAVAPAAGGRVADGAVGMLSGVVGGVTGVPTENLIRSGLRPRIG